MIPRTLRLASDGELRLERAPHDRLRVALHPDRVYGTALDVTPAELRLAAAMLFAFADAADREAREPPTFEDACAHFLHEVLTHPAWALPGRRARLWVSRTKLKPSDLPDQSLYGRPEHDSWVAYLHDVQPSFGLMYLDRHYECRVVRVDSTPPELHERFVELDPPTERGTA